MRQEFAAKIADIVEKLFNVDVVVELTRPEEQFGDFSTNVALQLAGRLSKNPREIASILCEEIRVELAANLADVTVAGPGFINLKLNDTTLLKMLEAKPRESLKGQVVVCEYSDPNPFKVLHAGHVYTTVVGDSISNLLENAGAAVHRVNYGGDVGRHVGICMWAIIKYLGGEKPESLANIAEKDRARWLSERYVEGNQAFETQDTVKLEVKELNKQIYQLVAAGDHDRPLAQIYWACRQWSYEAFDAFYARLGTKLEKYYPESEVADEGLALVKQNMPAVFHESDGAVIFDGQKYGLHNRVFINSQGLPTYEAKEVGLIVQKKKDYDFDLSVVITGNEQQEYMAVTLKAIEQFLPELAKATKYIPHGMVRLAGNVKMSSRKGNGIAATEVLDETGEAIENSGRPATNETILGAIKYSFLKNRIGGNLIYDPAESVSLEGNSGPYLQYAHARARSILAKADAKNLASQSLPLEPDERSLAKKVGEYSEVVELATDELMPHHICTYLYELAQEFNRFYERNRVIGDPRESVRLALVNSYADKLESGLALLGINAPEKM